MSHTSNYDAVTDVLTYISQLDLDDIESLQERSRKKDQDVPVLSDEELARLLFAEEAEGLLNIVKEQKAGSASETRSLMQELMELEEAARYDHQVALAVYEGRPIPPRPERLPFPSVPDLHFSVGIFAEELESDSDSASVSSSNDDDSSAGSSPHSLFDDIDEDEAGPSSSSSSVTSAEDPSCTICGDTITGIVITAPCGHSFDTDCMTEMFRKTTIDEALYPPRCCLMPIPAAEVRQHLNASIMENFDKKSLEFDTPVGSRVYCCRATCSAFLGASTSEPSVLPCRDPHCTITTCGVCRKEAHSGTACSHNKEAEELALAQMAEEFHKTVGWQRCYSCHHLVEKSEGCYHMTCICKAQFCYLCATPWKQCECPQFEIPPDLIRL